MHNDDGQSMDEWVKGWLASEDSERDKINVKRVYIDINDDSLIDGILFSQIMYWHGFNRENGKRRLSIEREGHLWLAKQFKDWWDECRIDERTAKRSMARLEKRGLIITKVWKFDKNRSTHIRVVWECFKELVLKVTKCPDVKGQNVPLQSDKVVSSYYTETTTENENKDSFASGDAEHPVVSQESSSQKSATVTPQKPAPTPAEKPQKPAAQSSTGTFTAGKYYPVCEAKHEIYNKTYTQGQYTSLLEAWGKHGIAPVRGSVLNTDAKYADYKLTKPPAKRNPTFDAFAECAFNMRPGFDPTLLNGDGGRVGKLVSALAELTGRTFNEVNADTSTAAKVRSVYAQWKAVKKIDPPRDTVAFIGAWNEFGETPMPTSRTSTPVQPLPQHTDAERAELIRNMAEAKAKLLS